MSSVAPWHVHVPASFRPGPGKPIADYLGGKGNSPATSRRPGDRSPRRRWDPRTVGHADRFKCERRGEVKTTQMQPSDLQYLPITPLYFSALIGLFVIVLLLIQLGAIRYAYMRLGISSGAALALLLGSLICSYFNVPIFQIQG